MDIGTLTIFFLLFSSYVIIMAFLYLNLEEVFQKIVFRDVKRIEKIIEPLIINQINDISSDNEINKEELKIIRKYFKTKKGYFAFNEVLKRLMDQEEYRNFNKMSVLIENYEDLLVKKLNQYLKKDFTQKTYMAFNLGFYQLSNFEIQAFLIKLLLSKEIHLRTVALDSIMKIHNPSDFVEALQVLSDNELFINERALNQIINKCNGEEEFAEEFSKNIETFNEEIQKATIDYFTFNNCDKYKKQMYEKFEEEYRLEIRISLLRYFARIHYDEARKYIIKGMNAPTWEERSAAARTIEKYFDDETYELLLNGLTDFNWYVRQNSAASLIRNKPDKNMIDDVFEKKDKFAIDTLLYVLKNDEANQPLVVYASEKKAQFITELEKEKKKAK